MNFINNNVKQFIVILMLFLSIGVMAQVKNQGSRITDDLSTKELNSNAILDLDSSSKGFYMPRMNTAQRDQLATKLVKESEAGKRNTGLVIYNTSNDCIEYWHATSARWRSLCGSLPPAKLDLLEGCGNAEVSSNIKADKVASPSWQQGMALKPDEHTITIRVYVSQVGTYQVSADSGNGYFFTAEGQFQSEGLYTIVLRGMGTPKNGYDQTGTGKKGDQVKFTFNGQPSAKCPDGIEFKIIPANLKFQINRETYEAEGDYFVGKEASEALGNKLDIKVNVDVVGTARVTAKNETLGLAFVGVKEFTLDGPNQSMTLTPMAGSLAPKLNELDSYDLTFEANVKVDEMANTINGAKGIVKIKRAEIEVDLPKVDFGREPYFQGTAINNKNIVTVPVKVVGSGKVNLRLKNAEGVEFVADNVELIKLDDPNQTQPVTFTPVIESTNPKKMPEASTSEFTLSGTGGRLLIKPGSEKIVFKLDKKPVAYTINCTPGAIKGNRSTVIFDKEIGDTYHIIVPVTVEEAGEYELNTTVEYQGLLFSSTVDGKKAVFKMGDTQAILYPVNKKAKPTVKGSQVTKITNNDGNSKTLCDAAFTIRVGYPDLNVLYFSNVVISADHSIDNYIQSQKRYGDGEPGEYEVETGKVHVDKFEMTYTGDYLAASEVDRRAAIAKSLREKKYNLIIIDGEYNAGYLMNDEISKLLETYVINKGWLIISTASANSVNRVPGNNDPGYFARMQYGMVSKTSFEDQPQQGKMGEMLMRLNGGKDLAVVNRSMAGKDYLLGFGYAVDSPSFKLTRKHALVDDKNVLWTSNNYTVNVQNSNFETIVQYQKGGDANEAVVIKHKTHNLFIFTNMEQGNSRAMMSVSNYNNYITTGPLNIPFTNGFSEKGQVRNSIRPQQAEYMDNFFKTVITKIMNE